MVLPRGSKRKSRRVSACARASAGVRPRISSTSLIDGGNVIVSLVNKETIGRKHITRHGRAGSPYWLSLVLCRHARGWASVAIRESVDCA